MQDLNNNILSQELDEETELYIQAVEFEDDSGIMTHATGDAESTMVKGQEVVRKSLPVVQRFIREAAEVLRKDISPDELELSFSFGISTDLKAFIASTGANANFGVKLKWKNHSGEQTEQKQA